MDATMEDVGRVVEPTRLSPVAEATSISTLDGWIESLMTCKQLAEVDVQRLCEKVGGHAAISPSAADCRSNTDGGITGKRGLTGGVERSTSRKLPGPARCPVTVSNVYLRNAQLPSAVTSTVNSTI